MRKNFEYIILIIWAYLTIVLPPFFIIYALGNLSIPGTFLYNLAAQTPNFQTMIGLSIALPSIGLYLALKLNRLKLIIPWKLPLKEVFSNFLFSFLLAYIFWNYLGFFSFLQFFGGFLIFSFLYFYLPQFALFLDSINFNSFKVFFEKEYKNKKLDLEMLKKPITAILVMIAINLGVGVVDKQMRIIEHQLNFLSKYPKIQIVKPKIVYYGTKVILLGKGFGWGGEIETKFKNREGNIDITLWNDTKVIFTIPLHWKEGDLDIWIQKPIEWDGKKLVIKSNLVKLRLIPRDDGWGPEDDEYFEQLKHLDKETLELNGYKQTLK